MLLWRHTPNRSILSNLEGKANIGSAQEGVLQSEEYCWPWNSYVWYAWTGAYVDLRVLLKLNRLWHGLCLDGWSPRNSFTASWRTDRIEIVFLSLQVRNNLQPQPAIFICGVTFVFHFLMAKQGFEPRWLWSKFKTLTTMLCFGGAEGGPKQQCFVCGELHACPCDSVPRRPWSSRDMIWSCRFPGYLGEWTLVMKNTLDHENFPPHGTWE